MSLSLKEVKLDSLSQIFSYILSIWLVGILYILAFIGYLFYFIMILVRIVQKFLKIVLALITISLIVAFSIYHYSFSYPEDQIGDTVVVSIPKGSSLKRISNILANKNIVRNSDIFYYYLRYKNIGSNIQAGKYMLSVNDGVFRTIPKLNNPLIEDILVTIPEGVNLWKIASILSHNLPIDSATFVESVTDTNLIKQLGLSNIKTLEGYLYPDSYYFPKEFSERKIIQKMVNLFLVKYSEIGSSWVTEKYSRHEIVSLASIVENEAQAPKERARIAAVFHNRLKKGIPIGADATVRYSIKKFTGPLRVSELNNNSPYNTRKFTGIPPGPICSPGFDAIKATVFPLKTNELFFVAKWDGSGEHYFSNTNAEHNRMKMKIRRENKSLSNW